MTSAPPKTDTPAPLSVPTPPVMMMFSKKSAAWDETLSTRKSRLASIEWVISAPALVSFIILSCGILISYPLSMISLFSSMTVGSPSPAALIAACRSNGAASGGRATVVTHAGSVLLAERGILSLPLGFIWSYAIRSPLLFYQGGSYYLLPLYIVCRRRSACSSSEIRR